VADEWLRKSIQKEGFREPLVVYWDTKNGYWFLAGGHHRTDAAFKMGIEEVPVVVQAVPGRFDGVSLSHLKFQPGKARTREGARKGEIFSPSEAGIIERSEFSGPGDTAESRLRQVAAKDRAPTPEDVLAAGEGAGAEVGGGGVPLQRGGAPGGGPPSEAGVPALAAAGAGAEAGRLKKGVFPEALTQAPGKRIVDPVRRAEEAFAHEMELYLTNGVAPNPEVAGIFDHIRMVLRDLYQDSGRKLSENDPEIRNMLDSYFTKSPGYFKDSRRYKALVAGHSLQAAPVYDFHVRQEVLTEALPDPSPLTLGAAEGVRTEIEHILGPKSVERITDVGHGHGVQQIVLTGWRDAQNTLDKLETMGQVKTRNYLANPGETHFRGLDVAITRPDGTVVRAQLHTPRSLKAANAAEMPRKMLDDLPPDAPESTRTAYKAWLQSIYEASDQDIDMELAGLEPSKLEIARENMRLVQAEEANELFRQGLLEPDGALRRAYHALELESGAEFDYATGDFKGGTDFLTLHAMRKDQGLFTPVYFPFMDARRANYNDWLLSKAAIGGRKAAQPGYVKRNTGYLYREGKYIKDPIEAYARRSAQATRYAETFALFREMIARFGRPIDDRLESIGPGEALLAPDGLLRLFKLNMDIGEEYIKGLTQMGLEDEAAMLRAVTEALPKVQRDLIGATGRVPMYAVPKAVVDRLQASMKPLLGWRARVFWDTPTQVWRAWTLSGSPRWVMNNVISNIVFSKLQGAKLTDVIRQLDPNFRRLLDRIVPEEAVPGFFGGEEQFRVNLGYAKEHKAGQILDAIGNTKVSKGLSQAGAKVRHFNEAVEEAFRKASYLRAAERQIAERNAGRVANRFWTSKARLEHLASHGADEFHWGRAIDEMNYFFNDYSKSSPVERQIIKRFMMPFWSFYKHSAQLFLTLPYTHPARALALKAIADVTNDMASEMGPLPSFLQGAIPWGDFNPTGENRFISTRGSNPFAGLLEMPIEQLHPILKTAIEQQTGEQLYTGREFSAPNVTAGFGAEQRFRVNKEGQAEPVERVTPNVVEALLRSFPQYRLLEQSVAPGATYGTASLIPGLGPSVFGEGVIRDPATGEARYPPKGPVAGAGAWAGIPTVPFDVAQYQTRLERDRVNALIRYLRQIGAIPPAEPRGLAAAAPATSGGTVPTFFGSEVSMGEPKKVKVKREPNAVKAALEEIGPDDEVVLIDEDTGEEIIGEFEAMNEEERKAAKL
jgi:ParB/Sulfiredoxin domain